ncbi:MAG: hypothetical protein AAFZ80_09055 [Cyanobacteria bacterium P01_A01_bin.105]
MPMFFETTVTDLNPTTVPKRNRPQKGFNEYAEQLNGRLAMVGFVLLIAIEYFTGHSLVSFIGLG